MALMIPNYIHNDCKSNAERRIFKRLNEELSENHIVFHSLGLARHAYKLKAEIDFVVISSRGLICLEIKGGRIKYERGVWVFINRFDDATQKRESPFEQASSGMYALRRDIVREFGKNSPQSQAVLGFGVIFTDQIFTYESPEWDLNRLIDEAIIRLPLQRLLDDLYDYSEKEIKRVSGHDCIKMTQNQLKDLSRFLRPNFDLIPTLSSSINESYNELIRLTEEQYDILDQLNFNKKIFIQGGAGTGKTILAVEQAKREAAIGKRVLFVCFNTMLAKYIRKIFADTELIEVFTINGYARKIISEASMDELLQNKTDEEYFEKSLPEVFEKAVVDCYDNPPFDVIVVDEGQDMNTEKHINMLDWVLVGGINDGQWMWFEDEQQNIFNSSKSAEYNNFLLEKYNPTMFKLTKNCRNTKQIGTFNSLATNTESAKYLVEGGLIVKPTFYRNNKEQLKHLDGIIKKLVDQGVPMEDVIILSYKTKEKSVLRNIDYINGKKLEQLNDSNCRDNGCLYFTTVHKYKGMESKVIIVTDVDEFESSERKALNYVAFSRPQACLELLVDESAKYQLENLAYNFGMRE